MYQYWPQVVILFLLVFHMGAELAMHGKPRERELHSFWYELVDAMIILVLTYLGGFYNGML